MSRIATLGLAGVITLILGGGVNKTSIAVFAMLSVALGFVWYFESGRESGKPPSLLEITLATLWLWVRRVIAFTAATFSFIGALAALGIVGSPPPDWSLTHRMVAGLFMFLFSLLFVWLAIFGQGPRRSILTDDMQLHSENKKRYKWWW